MRDFILGVDLDGVCGDYENAFRKIVAEVKGVDPASIPPQVNWDFDAWGVNGRDEFLELHAYGVNKRHMFVTMDPIEGCADALWRLSDAGVWIRIITHRLHVKGGHSTAVSDTVTWLDAHKIPYRDICFMGAKSEVQADCYVDDAPHNVDALRGAGNDVIVFNQLYNCDLPGPRASGWEELETMVMARLEAHKDAQAA